MTPPRASRAMQSTKYTVGHWTPDFIYDPVRKEWLRRVAVAFPLPADFDWPKGLGTYRGVGYDSYGDCAYFDLTAADIDVATKDAETMSLPPPGPPRRKGKR